MGLITTISNAANGLGVVQVQMATASHNVANANTEGYARQRAVQTEAVPSIGQRGFVGGGIVLQGVYQQRDRFVEAQLPLAFSNAASSSAESDALAAVSVLDPDATGNLTSTLGDFYASLRALAQNAGDSGLRQAAVDSARGLAASFNRTAASLETARSAVDQNVSSLVDEVNSTSKAIADLNGRISISVRAGQSPNDLLDERQRLTDKMANLIGTRVLPDDQGNVSLLLPGGASLVNGPLSCSLFVQSSPGNGGHLDLVYQPADGSKPVTLSRDALGGQLGGQLTARDVAIGGAAVALDSLASDFAGAINRQHQAGYDVDGNRGGTLFDIAPTATSAAAAIAVNPALIDAPGLLAAAKTATGAPGDAQNLQKLIATETAPLSGGLNVTQSFAKIVSDFGVHAQSAKDSATFDGAVLQHLQDARESASGVSVDDEMVNLVRAQRSYEALSKVISTADTMLDALMRLVT